MAHTNSTTNYSLPQFLSTDKPAWLTDVNPAYSAIDTGMHNAQVSADAAQADATQALDDAAAAAGTATTADAKASGAIASLAESFDPTATYSVGEYVMYNNLLYICTDAIVTPGPWTGSTNWTRASVDSIATTINSSISTLESKTASDIPYSAGVSIADKLDDIDEKIAFENLTSTITAVQGVTLEQISLYKQGKIAIMSFVLRIPNIIGTILNFTDVFPSATTFNTVKDNDNVVPYLKVERTSTGGKLATDVTKTANGLVIGEITFIVD